MNKRLESNSSGGKASRTFPAPRNFSELEDVFVYTGNAGKVLVVRGDESGLTAQAEAIIDAHDVMVNGTDTTPGYLVTKLEALLEQFQGGLTLTVQDPAADAKLKIGINATHPTIDLDTEINAPKVADQSLTPDHFNTYYKDGDPSFLCLRTLGTLTSQAAAGNHNHGLGTVSTIAKFTQTDQTNLADSLLHENGYGGIIIQPRSDYNPMLELRNYLNQFKASLVYDKNTDEIYISKNGVFPHPFKILSTGQPSFPTLTDNGTVVTGSADGRLSIKEYLDIYACFYGWHIGLSIPIAVAETFYQITSGMIAGECYNASVQNAREIKINTAGKYKIDYAVSLHCANSNENVETQLAINSSTQNSTACQNSTGPVNMPKGYYGTGIFNLAINDLISIYVTNHTAPNALIIDNANITLLKLKT